MKISLTRPEAKRIVRWFRGQFGLMDWAVTVQIQDDPPDWLDADLVSDGTVAVCNPELIHEQASIWVSNSRCQAADSSPVAALIHELFHTLLTKAGIKGDTAVRAETVWNRLDQSLERLYYVDVLIGMEKRKRRTVDGHR